MTNLGSLLHVPHRGEMWFADFEPVTGHEQGMKRPCLVISIDGLNQGGSEQFFAVPVTKQDKRIRFHVRLDPPDGGLKLVSFVMPEHTRSMSRRRLIRKLGQVAPQTVLAVEERLRELLQL